jgi:3-hydroxypropionate dehydrogenase (NADP+)
MIKKVTCIGAGVIGHGWATLFAWKGYDVALQDISKEILKQGVNRIRENLNFLKEKGLITDDKCKEALKRIAITTDIEQAVKNSDYVQESVTENYKVKKEVFKKIDELTQPNTILASSTSTLKMTTIQKVVKRPERCIVAHPWNPPYLIPLVEIVPGKKTSNEVVKITMNFMKKLGKVPVLQKKEVVGCIGNRLAAALWREAVDLVVKGVADVEDVDKAVIYALGIRWAIVGPHTSYHLGGGKGGIERYIEHLGSAMERRWRILAKWTKLSPKAKKMIVEGIKKSELVKGKSIDELVRWRDEKTIELLKALHGKELL